MRHMLKRKLEVLERSTRFQQLRRRWNALHALGNYGVAETQHMLWKTMEASACSTHLGGPWRCWNTAHACEDRGGIGIKHTPGRIEEALA